MAHEVGDEVAGLLRGEGVEEALGHDGVGEGLRFGDLGFFESGFLAEGAEGEGAIGLGGDDSGEGAAVLELENGHAVFGGDDGAGVDDVF